MAAFNGSAKHHPTRVMSYREWYERNNLSKSTADRLKNSGKGPRFLQLSDNRVGVTEADNVVWQESRAR